MQPDNTLLPLPQYFPQAFPTQTGRAERDVKCLSWATSHDVAVKVAIITCFGQAASSCPHREGRLCMTSPLEVVSSLCWRQASVFTQVDCQYTPVIARLSVSWYMHTQGEKYCKCIVICSIITHKAYRHADKFCIYFTYKTVNAHKSICAF